MQTYYHNFVPHDSVCQNDDIEYATFNNMDLLKLEGDLLVGTGGRATTLPSHAHVREQYAREEKFSDAFMESLLSLQCPENTMAIEPTLLEDAKSVITANILESSPMSDHELRAKCDTLWQVDAVDTMNSQIDLQLPLSATSKWPMIEDTTVGKNCGFSAVWEEWLGEEILQPGYQVSTLFTSSAETNSRTTATIVATPPSSTTIPISTEASLRCSVCSFTAACVTKLKIHMNKHTRPFRCTSPSCSYASAEKKSLQRHVLAKAKWDEEHRVAAQSLGVKEVEFICPGADCTYATIREDNLKRHLAKCRARHPPNE